MFKWLRRLWPQLLPRQFEARENITRVPVYEVGPFLPQFLVPPAVCPVRGPKETGIIFCGDHLRPLGWHEYQYWQCRTLPHGWAIMATPSEGAELPGTRWRDENGLWCEEWGDVDGTAAADDTG
jgi:hypothetical protein